MLLYKIINVSIIKSFLRSCNINKHATFSRKYEEKYQLKNEATSVLSLYILL